MSRLSTKFLVYFLRTQFTGWSEGSITEQRARQEKTARFFKLPKQVKRQAIDINEVS